MHAYTELTEDQLDAVYELENNAATYLYGKMGSGKTIVTLTAIQNMLKKDPSIRVLVIGSIKICKTVWEKEAKSWEHTDKLTFNYALGGSKNRTNAIRERSNITLVNYESLRSFCRLLKKRCPYDVLIIDELSKMKSPSGSNFKALRLIKSKFKLRIGLTGTPVSESFLGLYAQCLLLDDGTALGTNYEAYRATFFDCDYSGYKYTIKSDEYANAIVYLMSGLLMNLPDYRHTLPRCDIRYHKYPMHLGTRAVFEEFAKNALIQISGRQIIASNGGVLYQKLHQITQGFIYDEDGEPIYLDDKRLDALDEVLCESLEPTIIVYWFAEDLARLIENFPELVVFDKKRPDKTVEAWNSGEIPLLALHPRSGGHGLNLAAGGHRMVFYTQYWSRDMFDQVIARLWRRGQTKAVEVVILYCRRSLDSVLAERVDSKAEFERLFASFVAALRRG